MNAAVASTLHKQGNHNDVEYLNYRQSIADRWIELTRDRQVFLTDAQDLWEKYLGAFPASLRQYHNCHECRRFIERYGALALVDDSGNLVSPIWDDTLSQSAAEKKALAALARSVRRAEIVAPFYDNTKFWGVPETGIWSHFFVPRPIGLRVIKRGEALAASKRQDFITVMRALNEFPLPMLKTAVSLLRTDSLYRSEKVLGQAEWLLKLQEIRVQGQGNLTVNKLWVEVAKAPEGFCHPRASMIGTLLEDLKAGIPEGTAAVRFAQKMLPMSYQRTVAPPKAGAIDAATRKVQEMGLERSFVRRFALLREIPVIWTPDATQAASPLGGGIFDHLRRTAPAQARDSSLSPPAMTWEKFVREVLPDASNVEVAPLVQSGSYTAFVTAAHEDAPPILQWDREEQRNPVSWYFRNYQVAASDLNLDGRAYNQVVALTTKPPFWFGASPTHHRSGVMLVIKGAKELRAVKGILFPEILRSDLHGVRAVIEQHSRASQVLTPYQNEQQAAGLLMDQSDRPWGLQLRVTSRSLNVRTTYTIDRWN